MLVITQQPALLHSLKFGKYRGKTFEEIARLDSGYLKWLAGTADIDEDVRYTAEHWLQAEAIQF